MIDFARPLFLLFIVPWGLFMAFFYIKQRRALEAVKNSVSERFIEKITSYNRWRLIAHIPVIFAMGAALIISGSEPRMPGVTARDVKADNIVFMIDASVSMVAGDSNDIPGIGKAKNRLSEACGIAGKIVRSLPGYRFGLISFSGIASFHSPPTSDHAAIENYLKGFRLHVFQKMGTNYKAPLEALIHLTQYSSGNGFQGVLISDGEAMENEEYMEELKILKKSGIAVHAIGLGTKKGGGIIIYDPGDVVEGVSKPRTIKEATSFRVDTHLEKIAGTTGGVYLVPEKKDSIESLIKAIEKNPGSKSQKGGKGKNDISHFFIFLFAILFIGDILFIDAISFWREKIKSLRKLFNNASRNIFFAVLLSFLINGCGHPAWLAHKHNEDGIGKYNKKLFINARPAFEKSIGYNVKQEIPQYNLANNYLAEKDYSMAHRHYGMALELEPFFPEALYNDGQSLFSWGSGDLDKNFCNIERTIKLWDQAVNRFSDAAKSSGPGSVIGTMSLLNADYIKRQIEFIKARHEENKNLCAGKSRVKSSGNTKDKDDKDKDSTSGGGASTGGGGKAGADKSERDVLNGNERDEVNKALIRIKAESGKNLFNQTKPQQVRSGKDRGNIGEKISW